MKDIKKSERGMVIVEATIVFPVMFLVIFLMLFTGNAYLQKCRVDSYVNQLATAGAAYCADPMLDEIEKGTIPEYKNADIRPYRYLVGGMNDIEAQIGSIARQKIEGMGSGLFFGMEPKNPSVTTKYNNGFIYSTFSVDVQYKIVLPIRLLGDTENMSMSLSSHADMPVSDTTEFIRNVNMVEDYVQRSETITSFIDKVKSWFKK